MFEYLYKQVAFHLYTIESLFRGKKIDYSIEGLMRAILHKDLRLTRQILWSGINPNQLHDLTDGNGAVNRHSPLTLALTIYTKEKIAFVQELLNHGASPALPVGNLTPLHYALMHQDSPLGVHVSQLMDKVDEKTIKLCRLLALNGADPMAFNGEGNNILHVFAMGSILTTGTVLKAMQMFMQEFGLDVDARNQSGNTALHIALICDELGNELGNEFGTDRGGRKTGLLLKLGADLYMQNEQGQTPLNMALGRCNAEIKHLMYNALISPIDFNGLKIWHDYQKLITYPTPTPTDAVGIQAKGNHKRPCPCVIL